MPHACRPSADYCTHIANCMGHRRKGPSSFGLRRYTSRSMAIQTQTDSGTSVSPMQVSLLWAHISHNTTVTACHVSSLTTFVTCHLSLARCSATVATWPLVCFKLASSVQSAAAARRRGGLLTHGWHPPCRLVWYCYCCSFNSIV